MYGLFFSFYSIAILIAIIEFIVILIAIPEIIEILLAILELIAKKGALLCYCNGKLRTKHSRRVCSYS